MRRLVVATTNPGKVREINGVLSGAGVDLISLNLFPDIVEPEETGETFAENARLKALVLRAGNGLAECCRRLGARSRRARQYPGRALRAVAGHRLRRQVSEDSTSFCSSEASRRAPLGSSAMSPSPIRAMSYTRPPASSRVRSRPNRAGQTDSATTPSFITLPSNARWPSSIWSEKQRSVTGDGRLGRCAVTSCNAEC